MGSCMLLKMGLPRQAWPAEVLLSARGHRLILGYSRARHPPSQLLIEPHNAILADREICRVLLSVSVCLPSL